MGVLMDKEFVTEIVYGTGELGKSRSQKKRESTALQAIGEQLAALSAATLDTMELPADLRKALSDWQAMSKHEARRRQMQYIGRVMRELDEAEFEYVQAHLQGLAAKSRAEADALHRAEDRRERLLAEDSREHAVRELLDAFPHMGEKRLRHLVAQAVAEAAKGKKGGAFRELFRYLRDLEARPDAAPDAGPEA